MDNELFLKDLREVLEKHKAAIICDNSMGGFGAVGFQFALVENLMTDRCHVIAADISDLIYQQSKLLN